MKESELNIFSGKLEQALTEWYSKKRSMGCVAATDWLCKRVPGLRPLRLNYYTKNGQIFQHVVATDGLFALI